MKEFLFALLYVGPFIIAGLLLGSGSFYLFVSDLNLNIIEKISGSNLVMVDKICNGDFKNCIFEIKEGSRLNQKIPFYLGILTVFLFSFTFGTSKLKSNNTAEKIIKYFFISILYIFSTISLIFTIFYIYNFII